MIFKKPLLLVMLAGLCTVNAFASTDEDGALTLSNSDMSDAVPVEVEPTYGQATINKLNQIHDRYDTNILEDWTKYVTVHGGFYMDGRFGNTDNNSTGVNNNRTAINDAYLAVQATPNDWSKLDLVVNYFDPSDSYDRLRLGVDNDKFDVDQVFVTIGNLDQYPLFLQLGKQYLPFGRYELNPITKSLAETLSETNQTDAQVGFVTPKGLYGSAYIFENPLPENSSTDSKPTDYGVVLGFQRPDEALDIDVGVGYINNMTAVNTVEARIRETAGRDYYMDSVPALSPYARLRTGPFGFEGTYVTALDDFAKSDVPYHATDANGAKPWAADTQIDYQFKLRDMDNQIYVGSQWSGQASALGLPKQRYVVGYNWYPWKNTLVGAQITRDQAYGASTVSYDGTPSSDDCYYTVSVRAGVTF